MRKGDENGRMRERICAPCARPSIHPFPARMTPGLVLDLVKKRGARRPLRIVDPMAGSGTVLAVARDNGHRATGFDTGPLAVLIAGVWTSPVDRRALGRRAAAVLAAARGGCRLRRAADAYPHRSDDETRRFVRYWFDPTARRQLASLSAAIRSVRNAVLRNALWCAFSRLIITKQSGASLAIDLAHSRPHKAFEQAPSLPFAKFEAAVGRVADGCIGRAQDGVDGDDGAVDVRRGDARRMNTVPDGWADMVITSPPYLNAIDYMRCSKFSLVWMGHTISELRRIRAAAIGTEVGMYGDAEIPGVGLPRTLDGRTRAILARYAHDMRLVVGETARVLADGGTTAYVVGENTVRGTFIQNSGIIKALAGGAGLDVVSKSSRDLPPCSRYLPPPSDAAGTALGGRIRREVVLVMKKA